MNQELSRNLEIDHTGQLLMVISWTDEEVYWNYVTGVNRIKELLFFEVV